LNYKNINAVASIGAITAACIWGFAFVVIKDSLDYVTPIYILAFRFTIASFGLVIFFHKKLKLITKEYIKYAIIISFFNFLAFALQTVGCQYTTAGKNAFLTTIYVVLVPLIAWPLTKHKPGWYVFIAAFLSVTGIALLSLTGGLSTILTMNKGDIMSLLCGVGFAIGIIFTGEFSKKNDTITLTIVMMFFSAIFSWIVAPLMEGPIPFEALKNPSVIASMLFIGIFSTLIAYLLQNFSLKYLPASLATLFLSLESTFGMIFSVIFLNEHLTVKMIIGCIIIFSAILLAENGEKIGKKKIPTLKN
jgi:drug/metabolite transporter (DMT)-like permease